MEQECNKMKKQKFVECKCNRAQKQINGIKHRGGIEHIGHIEHKGGIEHIGHIEHKGGIEHRWNRNFFYECYCI